jgi:hypothetical protein
MELSILVQDFLRDLKSTSGNWLPSLKFLIMFVGAVVGSLVLLVVGGRDSKILSEPGLAWSFLAIALLLPTGLDAGFSMFMRGARFSSINSRRI